MKYLIIISLLFAPFLALTQSTTIEPGSIAPKMTTAERTSITSPQDGMLVFDENTQTYWYRSSGTWVEINGNGSGSPVVPEKLPKVVSKYLAISLPSEDVIKTQFEINDEGTICIGYTSQDSYHIVIRRNMTFERFTYTKGNSTDFKLVINSSDEILMVYDSTVSTYKRLKYRMFDGSAWTTNDFASPNFTSVGTFDLCLNDNSNATIAWIQPDAVTDRVFISEFDGTSWNHPSSFFDYFNPNWGVPSNAFPCSNVSIDNSDNNHALVTWKQSISGTNHAFKSENNGLVWTKPVSSSDFIDVIPTGYYLEHVNSSMNFNGDAVIVFKYYSDKVFPDGANYSYRYDIQDSNVWTSNVFLFNFFYHVIFSYGSVSIELIDTNSGFFVLSKTRSKDISTPSGGYSIFGNKLFNLSASGASDDNLYFSNGLDLDYVRGLEVDVNSSNLQQYCVVYPLSGGTQVFEIFEPVGDVFFNYESYELYLNEFVSNIPSSVKSKISENNRTRAVSWVQQENGIDRLYMSFID